MWQRGQVRSAGKKITVGGSELMLYINKLSDLNRKSADTDSVPLIREFRQKVSLPLTAATMERHFTEFLISESDLLAMDNALVLIEPTIEMIKALMAENDSMHERVNLERAIQLLKMMPDNLQQNIHFADELVSWRGYFIAKATELLNQIPQLRTQEQKIAMNGQVSVLFEKMLRNTQFSFNYLDVINEAHTANITGLVESLPKGYFFHITLEEELKKVTFDRIKERIPTDKLKKVEEIEKRIQLIKKGVDRAYDVNMRMVGCAVHLYSYVKWVNMGT